MASGGFDSTPRGSRTGPIYRYTPGTAFLTYGPTLLHGACPRGGLYARARPSTSRTRTGRGTNTWAGRNRSYLSDGGSYRLNFARRRG